MKQVVKTGKQLFFRNLNPLYYDYSIVWQPGVDLSFFLFAIGSFPCNKRHSGEEKVRIHFKSPQ